tara:strand:- start:162 stop:446 length:285 start_codon:yes stop_codon:yes gene_type:complete
MGYRLVDLATPALCPCGPPTGRADVPSGCEPEEGSAPVVLHIDRTLICLAEGNSLREKGMKFSISMVFYFYAFELFVDLSLLICVLCFDNTHIL